MKKITIISLLLIAASAMFAQTLQDAQHEFDNENYFKARQILFKLLDDPAQVRAEVAYYLGKTLLNSDDLDSSKIFFKMAITSDVKNPLGLVASGRLNLLAKNKEAANGDFTRALQFSKYKNANIYFEIGDAYLRPSVVDLELAIKNLEQAYTLDNKNTSIMLELGDAYLANSASDNTMGGKAMNKYEGAVALNPKLALAWIKKGRLDVNGRIYNDAIDAFNKALDIDHNYPVVYKELALLYYTTKQYEKVKPNFESYLKLSPGDIQARTTLASLYFQSKEYNQAIDESTKGLKDEPDNYIFQRIISFSNYELKRYKDASDASNKFWANPKHKAKDIDYIYSARIAASTGDTTQAMNYFKVALANDSNNCDLLGEYGKVLYQAKHTDEAINQYALKKAKCGKLSSIEVYYLGRCYVAIGDSINADTTFGEFIQRNPTSPDGYYQRAKNAIKLGKIEDYLSFPYYSKYIDFAETDPEKNKRGLNEAYDYLGMYYFDSVKDKAKAKEYFQKALEKDATDPFATEYMKQFK